MNCQKCGNALIPNTKFCTKCGEPVNSLSVGNQDTIAQAEAGATNVVPNIMVNTENNSLNSEQSVITTVKPNASVGPLNYFIYLIMVLLKPFKCFKEEENKLANTKTSLILSVIISGGMMLINLLKIMFSVIRTEKWTLDGTKTAWAFENLKDLNYVELILRNFFIYIGAIFVIGGIIYISSLIIKKEIKFFKSVSIAATAMIPMALGGMVLSPILGLIYAPLQTAVTIISLIYSIIMIIEYTNNEIQLDGDKKYYFYLTVLSIICVAGYFIYIKFFGYGISSSDMDALNEMLDMFG